MKLQILLIIIGLTYLQQTVFAGENEVNYNAAMENLTSYRELAAKVIAEGRLKFKLDIESSDELMTEEGEIKLGELTTYRFDTTTYSKLKGEPETYCKEESYVYISGRPVYSVVCRNIHNNLLVVKSIFLEP